MTSKSASEFTRGDIVVYPGHGVGTVTGVETRRIGDHDVKFLVIGFNVDRMTLRLPVQKLSTSGLRKVSTRSAMQSALVALKGPARQKRSMWRLRALEYTAKINSGDPVAIAEVVRDLHRTSDQPERSYSERLLYEQALGRLTNEVAAVDQTAIEIATTKLERLLNAA